ncbi:MAG: hypothetical protein K6F75_13340 [Butyrivibrio sp.]|nr:hypothetical protein [Butyrivibrio sp.]
MKERLVDALRSFFIIVTLINVAMLVLGGALMPDQKFGYEAFAYPLIYGAVTSIPGLFMGSSKELSIPQTIVRDIIQLLLIITALLVIMFGGRPVDRDTVLSAASVTVSVIIVFILVSLIRWILDSKAAEKMTADLEAYQRRS